jgi:hypothetical protein
MIDLSPLEIEKWYTVAVGEIGIPPSNFYQMTEDELKWAYEGYKQRQQDLANMFLLAINQSHTNQKYELFSFIPDKGYDIGSLEDRNETFKTLGIKEE